MDEKLEVGRNYKKPSPEWVLGWNTPSKPQFLFTQLLSLGAEIQVQHGKCAGRSALGYPQCPQILLCFEALGHLQGLPVASHC